MRGLDNTTQVSRFQRVRGCRSATRGVGPVLSPQYVYFAQTIKRDFQIAEMRFNEAQTQPSSIVPDLRLRQARHRIDVPPPTSLDTFHIPHGPVISQRHQATQIENWSKFDVTTQIAPVDFTVEGIRGKVRNVQQTSRGVHTATADQVVSIHVISRR